MCVDTYGMYNFRHLKKPVCCAAWRKTPGSNVCCFNAGWSHTQYQDGAGQGCQECCPDEFLPEGGCRWVWSSTSQIVYFQYTYGHFVKFSLSSLVMFVFPFSLNCLRLPWQTKFRNEAIWADLMASPTQRTEEDMEITAMAVRVCVKFACSNTYNIHDCICTITTNILNALSGQSTKGTS